MGTVRSKKGENVNKQVNPKISKNATKKKEEMQGEKGTRSMIFIVRRQNVICRKVTKKPVSAEFAGNTHSVSRKESKMLQKSNFSE